MSKWVSPQRQLSRLGGLFASWPAALSLLSFALALALSVQAVIQAPAGTPGDVGEQLGGGGGADVLSLVQHRDSHVAYGENEGRSNCGWDAGWTSISGLQKPSRCSHGHTAACEVLGCWYSRCSPCAAQPSQAPQWLPHTRPSGPLRLWATPPAPAVHQPLGYHCSPLTLLATHVRATS